MGRRLLLLTLVLGVSVGLLAATAEAGTITIDGFRIDYDVAGSVPDPGQTNDVLGAANGFWGATVSVDLPATHLLTAVTYTYVGKEAGYTNEFWANGALKFITSNGIEIGTTKQGLGIDGQPLDFMFKTSGGGSPADVTNIGNPNDADPAVELVNFFVGYISNTDPAYPNTRGLLPGLYLAFDDGGAKNDDNHDDMVVRLGMRTRGLDLPVPEPGTLILMGLGIAGIAAHRRRRIRQA